MFKINNKNTRKTSMTYFTPFPSVSIADFEQVNVSRVEVFEVLGYRYEVR